MSSPTIHRQALSQSLLSLFSVNEFFKLTKSAVNVNIPQHRLHCFTPLPQVFMDDLFQLRHRCLVFFHLPHQSVILLLHRHHLPLEQSTLFHTPQSASFSRLTIAKPPHNAPFTLGQLSVLSTPFGHCPCAPFKNGLRRRLHDRLHSGRCCAMRGCACERRHSRVLNLRCIVGMILLLAVVDKRQRHGRDLGLCVWRRRMTTKCMVGR